MRSHIDSGLSTSYNDALTRNFQSVKQVLTVDFSTANESVTPTARFVFESMIVLIKKRQLHQPRRTFLAVVYDERASLTHVLQPLDWLPRFFLALSVSVFLFFILLFGTEKNFVFVATLLRVYALVEPRLASINDIKTAS